MKRKRLYVMSAPSGAGKSTWIQNRIAVKGGVWISRDLIRLSLVEEDEPYFCKENEVLRQFYAEIDRRLKSKTCHTDIYIDATHLTPKARRELFSHIDRSYVKEMIGVSFEIPLQVALERNRNRVGRANVPMTVIRDMIGRFIPPILMEGYDTIIHVNEHGEERIETNE